MAVKLRFNEMNEIRKGTVLFESDESVGFLCVILKGRVELCNMGSRVVLGNGCFLGVQDLYMGRYLNNCVALEDTIVYAFEAGSVHAVADILNTNKDYRGLLMYSAVRYIHGLSQIRDSLRESAQRAYQGIMAHYREYIKYARVYGAKIKIEAVEAIGQPDMESLIDTKRLNYYLESACVPLETMKAFYGYGAGLALYPLEQAGGVCAELILENIEQSDYLLSLIYAIYDMQGKGLLTEIVQLAAKMQAQKGAEDSLKVLNQMMDECMDLLNELENLLVKRTGQKLVVDREKIEKLYVAMLTGNLAESGDKAEENKQGPDLSVLADSFDKITKFAAFDRDKTEQLGTLLESFGNLSDKQATDDATRRLRHGISTLFYDLYEQTFLRSVGRAQLEAPVELFLNFGFLSEKLLNDEEKAFLLSCIGRRLSGSCGNGRVYTIREWLTAIYEGRREASKNEMDEDYMEYLREQRKANRITEAQANEWMLDRRRKLSFEIQNMFKSNDRMVSGQISTFVPMLHHDMFVLPMTKSLLDCDKLSCVVERLKKIDYSVFYREVMYSRPEKGIDKIFVMKEYYPDIILMPTVGVRASMWQECSGKRRESAGRFIFPIFMEEDLEAAMAKTFGRYRWELCRFLQGGAWNNIQYHSLTADYCDYVQFYRKNHELSDERKEKLKLQIQKAKNSTREVFMMDYELWIRNESAGALRLNKVARELLATYCPFSREIRAQLTGQPMFEEAMARFQRQRVKTLHDYELRVRQLSKDLKDGMPQEITDTLKFYQES